MIDVKKATEIASRHLRELMPKVQTGDIGLEEVEIEGNHWEITLSFTNPRPNLTKVSHIFGGVEDRVYKKFGIHRSTGQVLFMRIRKP